MTTSPMPEEDDRGDVPSSRRATTEIRAALLARLDAPPGAVTVARRRGTAGDVLVVRTTTAGIVPDDRRPSLFGGFAVAWEVTPPPEIGPDRGLRRRAAPD